MARLASDLYGGGLEEEELRHQYNDNFTQKTLQFADIFETWFFFGHNSIKHYGPDLQKVSTQKSFQICHYTCKFIMKLIY